MSFIVTRETLTTTKKTPPNTTHSPNRDSVDPPPASAYVCPDERLNLLLKEMRRKMKSVL